LLCREALTSTLQAFSGIFRTDCATRLYIRLVRPFLLRGDNGERP
jgi:hypothetical protein